MTGSSTGQPKAPAGAYSRPVAIAGIVLAVIVGSTAMSYFFYLQICLINFRFPEKSLAHSLQDKIALAPRPKAQPPPAETERDEGKSAAPAKPKKIPAPATAPVRKLTEKERRIEKLRDQGVAKANQGDYDGGIALLTQALELDPKNEGARKELSLVYNARGWARFDEGDVKNAKSFFTQALLYWKDDPEAVRGMAFVHFHDNDREWAEQGLKHYIELGGKNEDAYNMLAKICYDADRLADAAKYYQQSLKVKPDQPLVRASLDKLKRETPIEDDFMKSESSHFMVKFEGREVPGVSLIVLVVCEQAYTDVGERLGYYPRRPVIVLLYTNEQFQDITQVPSWAGGVFDGKIRIPAKGLTQKSDLLEHIVFHEYTHAVIFEYTHGNAPVWFHEGLAQMSEDKKYDTANAAKVLLTVGGPIPLNILEGSFMRLNGQQAALAYVESWFATNFIEDAYGPYANRQLLEALAHDKTMAQAIELVTSRNYYEFNSDFKQWLIEQAQL